MYSYLKCIVYDKLLKPRQSFRITLYLQEYSTATTTTATITTTTNLSGTVAVLCG